MVFPNVQVIVQVPGKLSEERANYLREEVHKAVSNSVQEEVATLLSAGPGNSKYNHTVDLKLFRVEVGIRIDRQLSQQFLKFIVDNALKEAFTDLGREWAMESIENVTDAVAGAMDKAMDTIGKAWDSATQSLAQALDSAAKALNKRNDA